MVDEAAQTPAAKEVVPDFGDLEGTLSTVFEALDLILDGGHIEVPKDLAERLPLATLHLAKITGFDGLRLRPTLGENGSLDVETVLLAHGKVSIRMETPATR